MKNQYFIDRQQGAPPSRQTDRVYFGLPNLKHLRQYETSAEWLKRPFKNKIKLRIVKCKPYT